MPVAAGVGEAADGEMGLGQWIGANAEGESEGRETSRVQEEPAVRAGEVGVNQEVVASNIIQTVTVCESYERNCYEQK